MIYRTRIYETVRNNLPLFHEFFKTHLLPVQLRHGARLIGRWEVEDGRVMAVWEYDDKEACDRIEAAVRADPDSGRAQEHRAIGASPRRSTTSTPTSSRISRSTIWQAQWE